MPVTVEEWTEIDKALSAPDPDMQVFTELRHQFPHLAWTRCDASDVTESPYRIYASYDLHLLDSTDHCAHVTTDPERATGIVLARRSALR